ncbi:MAG: hypothetical protein ACRD6X_17385 [Pyrinomonadaceae bacterium]
MKPTVCIFSILIAASICVGQVASTEKWTRIESEKGEVSISVPPGFLVDVEKRDTGRFFQIMAYSNGVKIEMLVQKDSDSKNRIKRVSPIGYEQIYEFKIKSIEGREMVSHANAKSSRRIYIASGDRFYNLHVESLSATSAELSRFLYSIMVAGQPLYKRKATVNFPEEQVLASSLATSTEVREAFARKFNKQKANVEFRDESTFVELTPLSAGMTPAIIVDKPFPRMTSVTGIGVHSRSTSQFQAKLVVNFLANGDVGDIVVYSNSNKSYAKACVEAVRKIRFVPAKDGNKNIDSLAVVDYRTMIAEFPVGPVVISRP